MACACSAPAARAPTPRARFDRELRYAIVTVGRPSGDAEVWLQGHDARVVHYTFNDRGRGPDVRARLKFFDDGSLIRYEATGHAYDKQPIDEYLGTREGTLGWRSSSEHGWSDKGGYFVPTSDMLGFEVGLVRGLRAAPDHRVPLLPAGEARLEDDVAVDVTFGGKPLHLHEVAIAGLDFTPTLYWLDDDGELFAQVSAWISVVRAGGEALVPRLVAADQQWMAARARRLATTLAHAPPAAGLAITHARVFDAEHETVVADATVVIRGDRIAAVGDASTPVPAGAQVIDAHGRMLVPGLWDMHVHLGDSDGVLELASGVTTVRDMGNDIDQLAARMQRFDSGAEVGPRIVRAGLVDGPGKLAAPTGVLVATAAEAVAAVERYAKLGYAQIKIYSSVAPALVPVIAKAAHERGLRVSGHIPTGMFASEAVEAGYDEIQHVNFLFLQFLATKQDDTRTPLRYRRVAERGGSLDLDGAPVKAFLDLLASHRTVIDPTLVVFEGQFTSDPGELPPMLAPFAGRLPAQVERGARFGGLDGSGGKRATFRASFAALLAMVKHLRDRGITIVAGTDEGSVALPRELELYVKAGLPAPDVLALATLGAARVMHLDRERGSIAAGKQADLVLVDGDPTHDISAIRRADLVVCRGVTYVPDELYAAAG
ncbi:MAG: amidohydrolase family protein, partial [Acidobacteriota bacterium]